MSAVPSNQTEKSARGVVLTELHRLVATLPVRDHRFEALSIIENAVVLGPSPRPRTDLVVRLRVRGAPTLLLVDLVRDYAGTVQFQAKCAGYAAVLAEEECLVVRGVKHVSIVAVTGPFVAARKHRDHCLGIMAGLPHLGRAGRVAAFDDVVREGLACPIFLRPVDLARARSERPDRTDAENIDGLRTWRWFT